MASDIMSRDALRKAIEAATVVARPALCPEIELRQITPECALWRGTEADAEAQGLPEPYWGFCWAGGQAVARYILDGPRLAGQRVLDFGAGGGICGIAAALRGARVLAADTDAAAIVAATMNAALNGVELGTTQRDLVGEFDGAWDLVLAGDVTYEPDLAERVVLWLEALAAGGASVLLGDPDRGFLPSSRLDPVATYPAPADNDVGESFFVRTTVYRLGRRAG